MTCIPLRLEADGLEPLDMTSGVLEGSSIDTGFPIIRESMENWAGSDGALDSTSLSGPSVITLVVQSRADVATDTGRWENVQRLKAFCNPRLRPTLFAQFPGGPELQATVRIGQFSDAWTPETKRRGQVTTQWVNAEGVWYSSTLHEFTVSASAVAEGGRVYDLTFDRTYSGGGVVAEVDVLNAGDRDAWPMLFLWGPWSGETHVVNVSTGKDLVFDGISIADGEYLEIDTRNRTIRRNGSTDPADSEYDALQFPESTWWSLVPGVNTLRFLPTTSTTPARMTGSWRDAFS